MKAIFSTLIIVVILSCTSTKSNGKQDENPVENITWIKEHIKETKKSPFPTKVMIIQYTYNGETVFLVDNCYQCSDATSTLYNVKKEKLCTFGGMVPNLNNTCPDFDKKAINKKIIWKSF